MTKIIQIDNEVIEDIRRGQRKLLEKCVAGNKTKNSFSLISKIYTDKKFTALTGK